VEPLGDGAVKVVTVYIGYASLMGLSNITISGLLLWIVQSGIMDLL
jgi:hypothetical protein